MHHVMNTCDGGTSIFIHLQLRCDSEINVQLQAPDALLPMTELPVTYV
jgi:hypothetical protein